MKEDNNNKTGRTLIDLVFERPWTALLILFSFFVCIFFLGRSGIGVEICSLIKTSPLEPPKPADTTTNPAEEVILPVKPITAPNIPPPKPLVEKKEPHKKIIKGSLNFQTLPSSDYYFIKIQGKDEFQRVEKSGGFKLFVDPEETIIHLDIFNQDKERITFHNFDCTTSNTIQIIIK